MRYKSTKIFMVVVFMIFSFCLYSQYFPPPENVQVDEYTGLVTWDPPANLFSQHSRELTGYNVYLDGVLQDYTTALEYQLTNLVFYEEYIAGVSAVYDDPGESEIIEIAFIYLPGWIPPPHPLTAELVNYNDVHLEWEQPLTGGVLAHHSGYDNNGIGTGAAADWMCAARFDATDLDAYYGYYLNSVNVHIRTADFSYVALKIWEGGSFGDPGTEVYSEDITGSVLIEEWTEHTLTSPIPLVDGNEYWIGYEIHATTDHPSSVDAGPAVAGKGDWMFYEGIWQEISVAFALDYNWCIEGVVDGIANTLCTNPYKKKRVNTKIKTHFLRNMVSNGTPEVLTSHPRKKKIENNRENRVLLGYKVYRDDVVIAEIDDPNTLTYDDLGLDGGTYEYWVTAIYDEGEYPSNIEEITVILYPPTNLQATIQANGVLLTWDPPGPLSGRDLDYFNIYLNGVLIGSTTNFFFLIPPLTSGTFEFAVSAVYDGGWESPFASIIVILVVGDLPVPVVTELIGNYPNPFNPTTTISFSLTAEDAKHAKLDIYNLKGQKIKKLEISPESVREKLGINEVVWNGTDENNQPVSSGIYFYKLEAGDFQKVRKMILLK